LPESRVVKVNADLIAFEPSSIYIGITKSFKLGLREEVGDRKKNACPDPWTSLSTFVQCRASRFLLSEESHQDDWKERVWLP
jgi:hypothetical protein